LPISKTSHYSIIGEQVQEGFEGHFVNLRSFLCLIEGVVKSKSVVFDILGDAVDFILGLMHFYLRISARYGIDFSTLLLFFEDRSFTDTDCELCKGGGTLF
jgi:hypothetical protein